MRATAVTPRRTRAALPLRLLLLALVALAPRALYAQSQRDTAAAPHAAPARDERPVIVVMSGTFDPVHDGHLDVMAATRDHFAAGGRRVEVVVVPNYRNDSKNPVSFAERREILRRSLDPREHASIRLPRGPGEWAAARRGTSALMRFLRARAPDARIVRVLGTDSFERNEANGSNARLRAEGFELAVSDRAGHSGGLALPPGVHRLPGNGREMSSTVVRGELARGERPAALRPRAMRYILRRGLYGAQGSPRGGLAGRTGYVPYAPRAAASRPVSGVGSGRLRR